MITEKDFNEIMQDKTKSRHLAKLKEPFSTFVYDSIMSYGTKKKPEEANRVADFLVARLKKRGMYEDPRNAEWVAITYAATMIHNLFYDGSIPSLFEARERLRGIANDAHMNDNHFDFICQHTEGQLGDDCPVPMCRVKDDSPQGMMAMARWFVVELGGTIPVEDTEA